MNWKIIKLDAGVLIQPITFLVNILISTATFPSKWKIGQVFPLYKGKGLDRQLPGCYRPVTLLPAMSKIVELAIQDQMVRHMDTNGFFHPNQHTYCKGMSTTSALLQLAD